MLDFAATLEPTERQVWACRELTSTDRLRGYTLTARRLGLSIATVRAAMRAIDDKRERFAIIHAAGRLCGYRAPAVAALAAGAAAAHEETAARAHLEHCHSCRLDYTRHLRYLRSARFHGKVAALLPAPVPAERVRAVGGLRDWITDTVTRVTGHDPGAAAGQLTAGGAGRGLGTAAAVKLATMCFAGAGAVGACVATGVLPLTPPHHTHTPAANAQPVKHAPTPPEPQLPHGGATPTPTPTPHRSSRRRASTRTASSATTQGGTGPRSHEQTPASPAPSNAAANGASEFDPNYQPSKPQPAPVPAAPGGSEFF